VVKIGRPILGKGNSSRYNSVDSFKLEIASSTVCPWLTVPTSGHSAT